MIHSEVAPKPHVQMPFPSNCEDGVIERRLVDHGTDEAINNLSTSILDHDNIAVRSLPLPKLLVGFINLIA